MDALARRGTNLMCDFIILLIPSMDVSFLLNLGCSGNYMHRACSVCNGCLVSMTLPKITRRSLLRNNITFTWAKSLIPFFYVLITSYVSNYEQIHVTRFIILKILKLGLVELIVSYHFAFIESMIRIKN